MEADGWAFCGVPTRRRMNDGTTQPPPEGFTFVVFADPQGCVFDWDWVPSLQANPAIPRDAEERFDAPPVPNVHGDLLLGNITHANPAAFKPGRAWFSEKGDCVFWYIDGAESYAAREDEYLTAFYQLSDDPKKSVGFKLKMVSKLFETIEKWAKYPGEGIQVNFNADPVRIDLKFLMNAWLAANLPRSQELFPGMRLMEKLGLKELQESSPTVDIPKSALQEMQNV